MHTARIRKYIRHDENALFSQNTIGLHRSRGIGSFNQHARADAICVDRKSTRLNSSHVALSRMPSSAWKKKKTKKKKNKKKKKKKNQKKKKKNTKSQDAHKDTTKKE